MHLPGPAQVRRLQAAGVFPGASGRGQALKTPGSYTRGRRRGRGGRREGGEEWPEIRAVGLGKGHPGQKPGPLEQALGSCNIEKKQLCNHTGEPLSKERAHP